MIPMFTHTDCSLPFFHRLPEFAGMNASAGFNYHQAGEYCMFIPGFKARLTLNIPIVYILETGKPAPARSQHSSNKFGSAFDLHYLCK